MYQISYYFLITGIKVKVQRKTNKKQNLIKKPSDLTIQIIKHRLLIIFRRRKWSHVCRCFHFIFLFINLKLNNNKTKITNSEQSKWV